MGKINEELIDVWVINNCGVKCYCLTEDETKEILEDEPDEFVKITKEKVTKKFFEELEDFEGF